MTVKNTGNRSLVMTRRVHLQEYQLRLNLTNGRLQNSNFIEKRGNPVKKIKKQKRRKRDDVLLGYESDVTIPSGRIAKCAKKGDYCMSRMKEDLKDVFFSGWDDLHGKNRYLSLLLAIVLSALGYLIIVFVREHFSYEIYQLFVLGVIFLVVIAFGILGREKIKKDRKSDI